MRLAGSAESGPARAPGGGGRERAELGGSRKRLSRLDDIVREQEAELAAARRQIAAEETTLGHEWSLAGDLDNDLAETAPPTRRLSRACPHPARSRLNRRGAELRAAEAGGRSRPAGGCSARRRPQAPPRHGSRSCRRQIAARQAEHQDRMRQAAQLQNDAVASKAQVDNLRRERRRLRQRSEQAAEQPCLRRSRIAGTAAGRQALQARLAETRQALARSANRARTPARVARRRRPSALPSCANAAAACPAASRCSKAGTQPRGLGTGVREVIALIEQPAETAWRER